MSRKVAIVSLLIILAIVNWSIFKKEKHLAEGTIVYLDLAPFDPRSLMQGDYMALRFRLANEVHRAEYQRTRGEDRPFDRVAVDGYAVVRLDERHIGTFAGLYDDQPLSEDEIVVRYRLRRGEVKLATNAFFFQEGQGEYYQPARYGQFRVDDSGEVLLVALYDGDLHKLGPVEVSNRPSEDRSHNESASSNAG